LESAWCRFGKILGNLHKHLAPKRGEPLETVGTLKKNGHPALRRTLVQADAWELASPTGVVFIPGIAMMLMSYPTDTMA